MNSILATTEARRHNGECAYGPWVRLVDMSPEDADVVNAIADEVAEASCRDMRREPHTGGNTDDSGCLIVGGQRWLYRR